MKWIKEYFIKRALSKKKGTSIDRPSLVPAQIQRIGIIALNLKELEEVTEITQSAFEGNLEINGLFYDEKSTEERSFSHRSFSLLASPDEKVNQFLSLKADLIIFTSEKLNYFTLYLLHLMPQSYSIGFYSEELKPYLDLMLNKEGKDIKSGTEHLIKYLKQIN